jgi:hypothetical protein
MKSKREDKKKKTSANKTVSQKDFERTKIPKERREDRTLQGKNTIPSPLSLIPSAIIGRARPMTPTPKKGHQ